LKLKEFDILLDIKKPARQAYFEVVQGDHETNVLNITLMDGLGPYDITGTDIEIAFAKTDGTTVLQDIENGISVVDAESGKIECILKTNTIAAYGRVAAEVRVIEPDTDKLLTSARFDFFVRRAIFGDDTIKSTNEWPLYEQLINAAENEAERNDAEIVRAENEAERNDAEIVRAENEDTRIASEVIRQDNETIRQTNEQSRNDAEGIRQSNETARQASISDIENRWNELTTAQQQEAEVINARTSTVKGKTFSQLTDRIEEIEEDTIDAKTAELTIQGGIGSLPPTAVNSPVSCVIKGRTLTNLLGEAGNFENRDLWNFTKPTLSSEIKLFGNTSAVAECNGTNGELGTGDFNGIQSDKYYVLIVPIYIQSYTTGTIRYRLYDGGTWVVRSEVNADTSITGKWQYLAARVTGIENNSVRVQGLALNTPILKCFVDGIHLYEITQEEYNSITNGQAPQWLLQKYPYISDTKSTVDAGRLLVKDGDTVKSEAYINAKNTDGSTALLRSLPNGTKDEVNVTTGVKTQRNGEFVFDGSENYDQVIAQTYSYRLRITDWVTINNAINNKVNSGVGYAEDGNYMITPSLSPDIDWKNIVIGGSQALNNLYIHIPFSYVDNLSGKPSGTSTLDDVKNYLNQYPITLIYQLASPIITQIPAQLLTAGANYTVYWLPHIRETKLYNSGLAIEDTDLPIEELISVTKINKETLERTDIDIASCTVAADALSFTSTELNNNDMVEIVYEYDSALTTVPEIVVEYANNFKAQTENNTEAIATISNMIDELNGFTVAYLLNHEMRITLLENMGG